ncbi:ABC transporter permease [Paenibacillus sp. J5C_2022]|uniref:ABC transporter permease n=1 Tax=Paenibacillus sp. J5C2022 TaxID=2977129 RepID=UPI0021CEE564|nr:ABC transporter permease [Paenibacillus sp. J5C2022]MCU6709813.1 ABC transporter permease [Paenibacillus sp. J5C2022]
MTFRSLALSSIRGNWRAYSAFFLSSVFSVCIFYMYAAFNFHPEVVYGDIVGASNVQDGMQFALYLIIIFSFLFILYANSAFLKTRKQEFGLYSLFGMTRTQLRKLIMYENLFIAVFAITAGIGIGMLFSKLFFMAIGALLDLTETIPFAVPLEALLTTAIGFFALFLVISVWTVMRMRRTEIIDLLKAGKQPKGELRYSPILVAIGVISLGAGYAMALIMDGATFGLLALPILATVVVGTYFLFTQLSILLLRWAGKRKSMYYKRTNMLTFAQLGYKIKDNARILFVVSIMSAVVMTAMGTIYIFSVDMKNSTRVLSPYTIAYVEKGLHTHDVIDPNDMQRILKEDGVTVNYETRTVGIPLEAFGVYADDRIWFGSEPEFDTTWDGMIISNTDYNAMAQQQGLKSIEAEPGKLILIHGYVRDNRDAASKSVRGRINGEAVEYPISSIVQENLMNTFIQSVGTTFVMDDHTYANLIAGVPEEERLVFYGYELNQWEKAEATVAKLRQLIPEPFQSEADMTRTERFASNNQSMGLTLFIGMFISLLFFVAAGSMIYFKLFTELQEEREQFRSLSRIGITRGEIRRIIVSQIAIVFFIPCAVGISHALFAMQSLDNMMEMSNWTYSFVVIGIYIAMQLLYFLIASRSYMKSVLQERAT